MHDHRTRLRTTLFRRHQWGVGAAEALSHWRGTIEELTTCGALQPMVAADQDLVNMFGNVEWPAIRELMQAHFVEVCSTSGCAPSTAPSPNCATRGTIAEHNVKISCQLLCPRVQRMGHRVRARHHEGARQRQRRDRSRRRLDLY